MQLTVHILKYIRERKLLPSGERVGIAVSGGADSVALLHVLLQLRSELGIVPAVVHFNHKIRGPQSDADESFVAGLAARHKLEFFSGAGEATAYSEKSGTSLETAARNLRYAYFDELLQSRKLSAIATAHTLDDQAETVLMRMLRGSGTRGLAGIYPRLPCRTGSIVRPFLKVRRAEVVAYLKAHGQSWRDDTTNLDLVHTRNRVRHKLLPLLELEFNPSIAQVLGDLAEIARGEEEFWGQLTNQVTEVFHKEGAGLSALLGNPVAMRRRLMRAAAERAGITLDFEHIEALLLIATHPSSTLEMCELPNARAVFTGRGAERELRFELRGQKLHGGDACRDYEYKLRVPGEIRLAETGTVIRVSLVNSPLKYAPGELLAAAVPTHLAGGKNAGERYNRAQLLDAQAIGPELVVRNWRPGDRYRPAHRRAPKKVKELLQKTTLGERASWPVVARGNDIVWMRGFPPAADFLLKESGSRNGVLIEEESGRSPAAPAAQS